MKAINRKTKRSFGIMTVMSIILTIIVFVMVTLAACTRASGRVQSFSSKRLTNGGLHIGWAMGDITPEGPVSLCGQYYKRISKFVQSPLKVTAFAIESTNADGSKEQAIMVSMDLLNIGRYMQDSLRAIVKKQIPDFDKKKLFLNATHTHSAPDPDLKEYRNLILKRVGEAIISAWNNRKPAGISSEIGYAVVGHNRRVQYSNGTTEMYGLTDREDFIGMEGGNNPGVGMLFCWDMDKKLTGIVMNVSCPAQVTEAKYYVSSDYWGEVRKQIGKRFSDDVYVLPQCGAAGDLSPRDLPHGYKSGEPNMWNLPGIVEIGERLIHTIDVAYPHALESIQTKVVFNHLVKDIDLPTRRVTEKEYEEALKIANEIHSREPKDPNFPNTAWNRFLNEIRDNEKVKDFGPWDNKNSDFGIVKEEEALVEKYKNQDKNPLFRVELHVIRLGDIAFATNPFELYTDFGFRIMGRSKAKQTFLVQLSSGNYGDYLPTERAIKGGGYSAKVTIVGPEGGKMLVDETVKLIYEMLE